MSWFGDQDVDILMHLNNEKMIDEAELLSMMRIEYQFNEYFSQTPGYSGKRTRKRLEYFETTHDIVAPEDMHSYENWIIAGIASFVPQIKSDISAVKKLNADMQAGAKYTPPAIRTPIRGDCCDFYEMLEIVGSEILGVPGSKWTMLETFQATEELIHRLQDELTAQWHKCRAARFKASITETEKMTGLLMDMSVSQPTDEEKAARFKASITGAEKMTGLLMDMSISQPD